MRILANRSCVIGLLAMAGGALYGYHGKAYLVNLPLVTPLSSLYTQSLAWGMGMCGFFSFISGVYTAMRAREGAGDTKAAAGTLQDFKRLLLLIGVTVIAIFAMPYLGFMFVSALAVMVYMLLMNERRWKYLVSVPLVFCLALYLLFGQLLSIQFPEFPLFYYL